MPDSKRRARSPDEAVPVEAEPVDRVTGALPGTEALQAAALQAIAAAKAFLDLAEQAVRDPEVLGQVSASLNAVAKGVLGALVPPGATKGKAGGAGRDEGETPLEHIDVG